MTVLFVGCDNCQVPTVSDVINIPRQMLTKAERQLLKTTLPGKVAIDAYRVLAGIGTEIKNIIVPRLPTGRVNLLPCNHARSISYMLLQALGRQYLLEYEILQLHPNTPADVYKIVQAGPNSPWVLPEPTQMRVLISENMNISPSAADVKARMNWAASTVAQTASCDKLTKNSLVDALRSGQWKQVQIVTHGTLASLHTSDGEVTAQQLREFLKSTQVSMIDLVTCEASSRWAPIFLEAGVPSVTSKIPTIGSRALADSLLYLWRILAHPLPPWMQCMQHAWLAVQQGLAEALLDPERPPFPEYAW